MSKSIFQNCRTTTKVQISCYCSTVKSHRHCPQNHHHTIHFSARKGDTNNKHCTANMEATSTLADALLDDLDDLSDVESSPQEEDGQAQLTNSSSNSAVAANHSISHDASSTAVAAKTKPARFLDNSSLQNHLKTIRNLQPSNETSTKEGREREHQLIVQSNKLQTSLADELIRAHGELCEAYKPKFPELEELLPNPVQYIKSVRVIGNEMDITKVSDALSQFLSSNQILTVSVSASTTSGRLLTDAELATIDTCATYMEQIIQVQDELTRFVESRMEGLAPSVCALVGPTTAARLIGIAGGLSELSKIPACNLEVLGQVKQSTASRAGLSTVHSKPHQGILMECDLIQQKRCPSQMRRKMLKLVAAKLALAARCDFVNVDTGRPRSAAAGAKFRAEIESKLEKMQEPDKAPTLKALPKPDLTTKKRRGGKRMRRLKERFEETAMMKQANTRAFSVQAGAEYSEDAMGRALGLLDTADVSAGGALRKTTEKRKIRFANTKASRKRAAQMNAKAQTSGLASSVVFTPVQGMELVNPDAMKDRVKEANKKWFADNAGFQSALPKK